MATHEVSEVITEDVKSVNADMINLDLSSTSSKWENTAGSVLEELQREEGEGKESEEKKRKEDEGCCDEFCDCCCECCGDGIVDCLCNIICGHRPGGTGTGNEGNGNSSDGCDCCNCDCND